jgi:uncharacterized protein (TIGR03083 family)
MLKTMLRPPQPIIVTDLLPEVLDQLLELLRGLGAADWRQPTVCPGWSVKDVALHLLGVEVGNLSRRRDGHSLGGSVDGWDELVTFINDWNQRWVQVARRISSQLLIDLLQLTGGQMCAYFGSLDLYAMGGPVSWAGSEPQPVWLDIAREYTERWHHQQHIRDAVGQPGLKGATYLASVLAAFAWALPRTFSDVRAADGTTVTLDIPGDVGGQWSVRREGNDWRLYQGTSARPEARVTIDADVAWRLFTRGLDPDQAQEHITFTGDRKLGGKVLDLVSIIA